jgi:nicotinate phosphoribosyltransferase
LNDEPTPNGDDYEIFDPNHTWKRKTVKNFTARKLLVPIFKAGKCVYESPKLSDIKAYCKEELDKIWDEVKRFENPHIYYVDLSQKLWDIKYKLLSENK